ncbi:hypothetical protein [Haloplanus aerogenes]|uniref:DUF8106 domain-containing protein n=1 Tax=Haloplanus aerogenes TaxID=660522 RepID=A0A3M0E8X3_9EURY|nr:hypothetical protein [Haloplanus aerogenes]AZH24196.1 hypothetical protein DU502_01865 [Haloplanus aerogenes]RMB24183.1 hypothetical protein ATH50_1423 [Haloplanus aerogenes]
MSPSPLPAPSADDARGRKTVLFCQDCGHASPVDGDWRVRTVGNHQRTRCPECLSVVDDRRLVTPLDAEGADDPTTVRLCVDAWSRYWSELTTLFTDGPTAAESDC